MPEARWHSSAFLWIGLTLVSVGVAGALLISLVPIGTNLARFYQVGFAMFLVVVTIVIGVVIITTWAAHRWRSSRTLLEEMGVTPPLSRDEPWLEDVIRRRRPPETPP